MHTKLLSANIIAITVLFSSLYINTAFADGTTNCQPIYGGGTTCLQINDLSVDKKILNPQTGSLSDNLTADNYKFTPGQIISFQVTLKNTSGKQLSNITLKDIFPNKYLNFYSGPGKFDNNSKTMAFSIDSLNKDESKDYTIRATVTNDLPANQTICLSNQAQALEGNQISQDNTQFCLTSHPSAAQTSTPSSSAPNITKGRLPIYRSPNSRRTPSTGPEDLAVFGLIPTGALGWFLRKKTKKLV